MIAEMLLYAATRAGRTARSAGLLTESVGLWSRGRRQRAAWSLHEEKCHAVVARAIAHCAQKRTVVVLGSGLCRDIPMPALLAAFERVLLVDAVHLPSVRWKFARNPKVSFISRDLTGALDWMMGKTDGRIDPLADLRADKTIDLMISANILSQLPIAPEAWLDRHPARAAAMPDDFLSALIGWHLHDLQNWPGHVCLLTDVRMDERDRSGQVTDRLDLMHGHVLPVADAEWTWSVAPFGEVSRTCEYIHHMHGYADFHAALRRAPVAARRQAA